MNDDEILGQIGIEIGRSEECYQVARELSNMIMALPLSQPVNDRLVAAMIHQAEVAERDAFVMGFKMGQEYGLHEAESDSEPDGFVIGCGFDIPQ